MATQPSTSVLIADIVQGLAMGLTAILFFKGISASRLSSRREFFYSGAGFAWALGALANAYSIHEMTQSETMRYDGISFNVIISVPGLVIGVLFLTRASHLRIQEWRRAKANMRRTPKFRPKEK